jgi:hypothetical protein
MLGLAFPGLLRAACGSVAVLPPDTRIMNGQVQDEAQQATGAKHTPVNAQKNLHDMRADVSMCRHTIVQLRGMLSELQRKQTEAIADMFRTVVFRLNGVKRVDSPSKQQ